MTEIGSRLIKCRLSSLSLDDVDLGIHARANIYSPTSSANPWVILASSALEESWTVGTPQLLECMSGMRDQATAGAHPGLE